MKIRQYFVLIFVLASCARNPSRTVPAGFIAESNILARPFQVVHAEKTRKIGDSAQVKQLQHLLQNDLLKLENSGYLIIAHFTGMFFEFEGDTTIDISELAKRTSQQLNITPNVVEHRSDIHLLFQDERKFNYYPGAVSRCVGYPMDILTPATSTSEISATNPEICISWEYSMTSKPDSFEIQIKNVFDEPIDTFSTDNSELTFNLSQYENEGPWLILKIYDSQDPEISIPEIGIRLGKEHYFHPKSCRLSAAIRALETAYYLESNGYYFDATRYYVLATELSERPIFTELLRLHKGRE